jgi:hypothetical protein
VLFALIGRGDGIAVLPVVGRLLKVSPASVHLLSATDLTLIEVVDDVGVNTVSVALATESASPATSNLRYDTVTGEPSTLIVARLPKLDAGLSD